jgi:hypothetical protein
VPADLLDAARNRTGLDDFGDGSFRDGLDVLVRSATQEARLNAAGEGFLYPRLVGHLSQRLQVEEWYRRHPEIAEVDLGEPLIGVGLPRTGSTALSFLLAQDTGARSLLQYEATQPCPPPSTVRGHDPRIGETEHSGQVGTRSHVPSSVTGPIECQDLMALDFKSHIFQAFAQIPSYSDWLVDADLSPTYAYERRVLKLLQWGCPSKPWRLKCPTHLLFLDHLDTAFPDARFVMTHRDPTDVIPSVTAVYADIVGSFTDHVDLAYLTRLNVEHWSLAMKRALAFRDAGADHRFYDIGFRAMQADPVGEVTALYAWLGKQVTPGFAAGMQEWWAQNAENREPADVNDPARSGLDLDAVKPRFAEYVARMERWTDGD